MSAQEKFAKQKNRIDGYQAREVPGKQKDEFCRPHGHHWWLCPERARVDMELPWRKNRVRQSAFGVDAIDNLY
jgi:hypothetical protein